MRRTRNAVYLLGIGGSNPSLSAKKESLLTNANFDFINHIFTSSKGVPFAGSKSMLKAAPGTHFCNGWDRAVDARFGVHEGPRGP